MDIDFLNSNLNNKVEGLFVLKPIIYKDERGLFMESWNQKTFNKLLKRNICFVQDNYSESSRGVLRGMHFQIPPFNQDKLVRCIKGKIFDVVIDLRRNSQTFGQWASCYLDSESCKQLWIPSGFAHGFFVTSKKASVIYKTTNYWSKEHERAINWNDKDLSIDWPLEFGSPSLSEKDLNAGKFSDYLKEFVEW